MRCALVGDQPLVEQCADIARERGLDTVLIATTNPIVRQYAQDEGIAVVGSGAELEQALEDHPADVLISVANPRGVPSAALNKVPLAVNLHEGPLPRYGGLNATSWAILQGEPEYAITWHLITPETGGGEIVTTSSFPIAADETAFSLNARCYEAALATFPEVAAAIAAGTLATRPQPPGERRVFGHHDRPAVLFDPHVSAAQSARAVRALDLGHRLRNSVGHVRLVVGDDVYVIDAAEGLEPTTGAAPGTVVALDASGVRVATADGDLVITAASTPEGTRVELADIVAAHGIHVGDTLAAPPAELATQVVELERARALDEDFWLDRLDALDAAPSLVSAKGELVSRSVPLPDRADDAAAIAALALWLARVTAIDVVTFTLVDRDADQVLRATAPLTRAPVAVISIPPDATFDDVRDAAATELQMMRSHGPFLRDAVGRDPGIRGRPPSVPVTVQLGISAPSALPTEIALQFTIADGQLRLDAALDRDDPTAIDRATAGVTTLLEAGLSSPSRLVTDLPVLGAAELSRLDDVNRTDLDHDRRATIDELFHAQVMRTPGAPALSFGDTTLTYAELEAASRSLARRLADAGVGRGDRVGIAVPRGASMVAGVLATLDLGAAYLPLDPTYPNDRLAFMVDDAGVKALLATGATAVELARPELTVIDPRSPSADGADDQTPTSADHDATDLAYVIYTSGSTGTPKGVMLEHRQVSNFFVAMDQVIDHDPPGTWLAVTSLSFDISVLELLWTLTRGFHVVLKSDRGVPAYAAADAPGSTSAKDVAARPVTFSLFYFAAGEETAADGYRLLLDSARFADRNGFEAVWTPERHFHAFGGAYPNPSITGAALAAVTSEVGIRAGSVVLPLHSPIRVAEEWAVVDNISRGRVAISFASGWQPDDFVLNPGAFATAKQDLPGTIEVVRQLWRGDAVSLPGPDGPAVSVRTLPRPVQAELPVWLTSAGTPATFERAGKLGVNVLTHLLGQSVEQLAENITRYREARRAAGHEGEGRVTLMMHTYLDRDAESAREVAREPMKAYLRTAVGLLRDVASAFPIYAQAGKSADDLFASLSETEMDQLLEMAAHRYLSSSGLFGTPEDVADIVDNVAAAGVDEVACLIDFGVALEDVFRSLDLLLEAKVTVEARREVDRAQAARRVAPIVDDEDAPDPADDTVAALVDRHGVSHLQCTPSLAAMLVADPADHRALARVDHLMLGGEALPTALGAELRRLLPGRFTNMYGPTETTIWSLTQELDDVPFGPVPIGTPIANTSIFVLDAAGHRVPIGAFGELHIGGEGVARGYHNRPELTAERFVDRPGMGRVYATGDVVRLHAAGYVEFAGRADNQVKIRGHRVELGEIEAVLDTHPDVVQSVVVAADSHGDARLLAYVVLHRDADVTSEALRKHVGQVLPEVMVPAAVIRLDGFPLTPNGKIDRKALPAEPAIVSADAQVAVAPLADDVEQLVADVWTTELGRPVGRDDNFFDIGGHSLLAVKVFRRLTDATSAQLALTDVFRFPTVRTFAAHLSSLQSPGSDAAGAGPPAKPTGTDRGAIRRRALTRRRGGGDDSSS